LIKFIFLWPDILFLKYDNYNINFLQDIYTNARLALGCTLDLVEEVISGKVQIFTIILKYNTCVKINDVLRL
jgi:hypothetical protein